MSAKQMRRKVWLTLSHQKSSFSTQRLTGMTLAGGTEWLSFLHRMQGMLMEPVLWSLDLMLWQFLLSELVCFSQYSSTRKHGVIFWLFLHVWCKLCTVWTTSILSKDIWSFVTCWYCVKIRVGSVWLKQPMSIFQYFLIRCHETLNRFPLANWRRPPGHSY